MSRVRLSIQEVQRKYDTGEDRTQLENLVKAFRGIQAKEPSDPNSFFCIAGYHGEPFTGEGAVSPDWWGGYCNHGNVLFPTWHRAYCYRLENALRSIPGCENVTLPFWDETSDHIPGGNTVPSIFTNPHFPFESEDRNPLYSYKLQKSLDDRVIGDNSIYSKPKGYETVRYPLSGLVGTPKDQLQTQALNARFKNDQERAKILNDNVAAWLDGTIKLNGQVPDHYSVSALYKRCLDAPNYTAFSNTTSATAWQKEHASKPDVQEHVVPLESPHNSVHLAVGGFEAQGANFDTIPGANGDMGENDTAGFDPIFFFHHCFVDYVFWRWQVKSNLTKRGSLTVLPGKFPGTFMQEGTAGIPPGTLLDMNTSLVPFKKPTNDTYYTSNDVTDIADLGYSYGPGSLDQQSSKKAPKFGNAQDAPIVGFKHVSNINRAKIPGSFVIRTYAITPSNKRVEIGREAILSRWNVKGCQNCQNHLEAASTVPIDEAMLKALREGGHEKDIKYEVVLHTRVDPEGRNLHMSPENRPKIGDL